MAIDLDALKTLRIETVARYEQRDTILYALGVGAGITAAQDDDLRFVYEDRLEALPTMAVVLAYPGFWLKDPRYGVTWQKILHSEQSVQLHRPLPVEGNVRSVLTVDEIFDKGADKGAVLYARRELFDEARDELIATLVHSVFLRGDGGVGGATGQTPRPHAIPERPRDAEISFATRPEQALLYRLLGDPNPLHIDPQVATQAGFPRPILHGLATYGIAGRAVIASLCDNSPQRLRRIDVRFSSPVYPGETIVTEVWNEGNGKAAFRARVAERDVVVINNGYAEFD